MNRLARWYPVLLVVGLELVLWLTNYQSGTWLIGWDNLQPNLNFKTNLVRSLVGIWQEYRGLGVFDGMAHAANYMHTLVIGLLSFVVKASVVRYGFHFLMHLLGGVGVYHLVRNLMRKTGRNLRLVGLVSGLFYMLNIGTIQMFYAPLEVFSYHFVALPWLSLWLMRYLKTGKKRDLWLLGLGSVFVLPQAFVPTLWLVYLGSVGLILAFNRKVSRLWYKLRLVLGLVILVNAVWLLPYMYGLVKTANRVTSSKINQVSNENILLRNKAFGDFKSVSLIKGFSFDYTDWQSEGESDYMMLRWREWFLKREVEVIGWLFFGLSIWGLGVMLQEKRKTVYPFGGWFLIGFLMLGNQVPGVKWVFQTLTLVPFFKEAFRFVFTKFSLVYVFSMSLLIAVGLDWWLKRLKSKRVMVSLLSLGLGLSLVYYAMPAFKGEFFYENLQVDIPQEYFELIEFFKNENHNSRLVVLPQPDFWGWTYYDWGFRGSGFIWQGLPQASLDGAFLPWSRENENYYWEMNQSILSQDREAFELVMNKYDIGFVVIDKNIKGSGGYKALNIPETEEILSDFRMFELVKDFGELEVYKVKLENPVKDFVKVKTDLVTVGPEFDWNDGDVAFKEYGDYVVSEEPEVYYPFRSLFSGREQEELKFRVEDLGDGYVFRALLPKSLKGYGLVVPELEGVEEKQVVYQPVVKMVEGELQVLVKKDKGVLSYDSRELGEMVEAEAKSCNPFNTGEYDKRGVFFDGELKIRFRSVGSSNCVGIDLTSLSQNLGYLARVESRHVTGKSLLFYVTNLMSQSRVIETQLPKDEGEWSFVIPPMEEYGLGYSLNFDNISIGKQETVNELGRVEVYPVPYRFLKQIKLVKDKEKIDEVKVGSFQGELKVKHPNPSYYEISVDGSGKGTLVLSQAFDKGWVGYKERLFGERLENHVLVNNWANGWEIDGDEERIVLWFWPQGLEYVGFLGLVIGFWLVLRRKDQRLR